jgi:hypothetical protein
MILAILWNDDLYLYILKKKFITFYLFIIYNIYICAYDKISIDRFKIY